jgi:excisionase family DNA binding protein
MDRRKPDRRNKHQDHLMSDAQVAELVGVSKHTVKYWRHAGTLPFVRVGRHPRIWFSVFQKVFHKPEGNGPWELSEKFDKMPIARDIRGKR